MLVDTIESTYTEVRKNFATFWDQLAASRQTLVVHRRGVEDIAILPEAELSSLMETARLLRSPRNAARLLSALEHALQDDGTPRSVEQLAQDVGITHGQEA